MNDETRPVILLPFDFTEVSKCAIKHAVGIAKSFNYSITLLNIMDINTKMYLRLSNIPHSDIENKLKETCDSIMQANDIKVDHFFRKGNVVSIHDVVKDLKVSYVVMGIDEPRSHSSPVMKMIGKSPRPVIVIQQKSEYNGYKNILFPLDDFPSSRQKAPYAARIAKASGATINIFAMNSVVSSDRYKLAKIIEQAEAYFHKNEIPYKTEFAGKDKKLYPSELLEYILSKKFDLITIMHRPPTVFAAVIEEDKRLIFNDAKIPVVCVNPRDLGVGGGIA